MGYAKKGQLSATTTPLLLPLPLQVHINRNGFLFLDTAVLLLQLPFTLSSKSCVFLLLLSDKACLIAPPFKAKINCLLFLYLCFDPRQVKKGKKALEIGDPKRFISQQKHRIIKLIIKLHHRQPCI